MKDMTVVPFFALLNYALDNIDNIKDSSKCKYISDGLKELGIKITTRSIQRYRSGDSIPSLETATIVLDFLQYPISQELLIACLQEGKNYRFNTTYRDKNVPKKITINAKDFCLENITSQELMHLIEKRANELYPDKKNSFSYYIEKLIEKDLFDRIAEEEI